jgi:hypothetical protein
VEVQQRLFEKITRDITASDLEKKIVREVAAVEDDTFSSVKNDESDNSSGPHTGPQGDNLETVLLPKLRSFAESDKKWGTILDQVESLKNQLSNGSLRNRKVYDFVNYATGVINESDMPPSPTSSKRSESSKLVYEIATYFVDKLNSNAQKN